MSRLLSIIVNRQIQWKYSLMSLPLLIISSPSFQYCRYNNNVTGVTGDTALNPGNPTSRHYALDCKAPVLFQSILPVLCSPRRNGTVVRRRSPLTCECTFVFIYTKPRSRDWLYPRGHCAEGGMSSSLAKVKALTNLHVHAKWKDPKQLYGWVD